MLWRVQRDYYDQRGIQAWSLRNVPQRITTTPHIARAYARIALGYLRDVAAQLDDSEPVYIVELGAGSGRFGYRFVKRLQQLIERSSLTHKRFTYVMTDASPPLVQFWQNNETLRPLVESGVMDFAEFDATQRDDITLINSGTTLRSGLKNPLIVVANYLFDSVPHDCFSERDGELFENLVTVRAPSNEAEAEVSSVAQLNITFEAQPANPEYYADPARNHVLDAYRQRIESAMLLLPVCAMDCVRHFEGMSASGVMLLVGDVGSAHEEDLYEGGSGGLGAAGGFWLHVNFHALGEYIRKLGGQVFHPPHRHMSLNVSAFILGGSSFEETALAYEDTIAQGGPDDFFMLSRVTAARLSSMSRDELLAYLRSTGWDSDTMVECLPYLLESLETAGWSTRQELYRAFDEAWDVYYPIGDGGDVAFCCGAMRFTIGDYPKALEYFQRSLQLSGMDPEATFNLAVCLHRLGRVMESLEWLDRTLELNPASESAQSMRETLRAERNQGSA